MPNELKALRKLAKVVLGYSDAQIASVMASGVWWRCKFNGNKVS